MLAGFSVSLGFDASLCVCVCVRHKVSNNERVCGSYVCLSVGRDKNVRANKSREDRTTRSSE